MSGRSARRAAPAAGLAVLVASPGAWVEVAWAGGAGGELGTIRVAAGLNLPVYALHAPEDPARLFIVEKPGRIRILDLVTGELNGEVFLDIDPIVGGTPDPFSDPGLLGMAFHPRYPSNGYFYVHYVSNQLDTHIRRYRVSSDPDVADPDSGNLIFSLDQPYTNHKGGWIGFGPDGYLYVPLGDGGSQQDPENRAQNLGVLHGKILRLDVDGDDFPGDPSRDYAIPPDNPFVNQPAAADEIWSYGLRNPWRCSFDALSGDLWIADVGQYSWEEIDVQPAGSAGRENYGWRCYEGNHEHIVSGCPPPSTMVFPLHEYGHDPDGGHSIIGGYVYRGCAIPAVRGSYLFADYISNHVWSLTPGPGRPVVEIRDAEVSPSLDGHTVSGIVSFGTDAGGEIYIVEQGAAGNQGEVFRIVPRVPVIPSGDLNCDGLVSAADLTILLASWGPCYGCPADLDLDGVVGIVDLQILLSMWR